MAGNVLKTYSRLPVSFEKGDGCYLYDSDGKQYLDSLCGIAVTSLGHNHPEFAKVITEQANKLLHVSNLVEIPQQEQLADKLVEVAGFPGKVFFNNSGAEACETAIKLARLHGNAKGFSPGKIVVMEKAFHGRTMATLSAGGSRKVHAGFEPLVQGFIRAPFGDIESLKNIAQNDPEVVAVLMEPIQGEGGIHPAEVEYLEQVRALCTEKNWIMMMDEIQTGIGRTGKMFAFQYGNFTPDVLIMAKALGNGIPIGACMISDEFAELFKPGSHGTTFGGNPLSSAAALSVLNIIESDNLCDNAKRQGDLILSILKEKLSSHPSVIDIRGKGLMMGIEVEKPCRDILKMALEEGIVFNIAQEKVLRLLPPLTINEDQAKEIANKIVKLVNQYFNET